MRCILPVAAILLLTACTPKQPPAPAPAEVRALKLVAQPAVVSADYAATVAAAEQVEIRARVGGLLERRLAAEGQPVRRGQALFQLDRQPLRDALIQAEAALLQAQAASTQTARELQRAQSLGSSGALSQQELDAASSRAQSAAAAAQSAQAAVAHARSQLGYAEIQSPIDGVMGRAELRDGALVSAYSSLLTTVYATDPLYVNFALSEQELGALQPAGAAPAQVLKVRLLLNDGSLYAQAPALDLIDPAVNPQTGTIGLRLRVSNPQQALRPGQYLRVRLTTRELPAAILVPQRAVQELQGKRYVWIVDASGKAQQRDVQLGAQIGSDWLVLNGLEAGAILITDGAQRLRPGVAVKILPAESSAPAGARP